MKEIDYKLYATEHEKDFLKDLTDLIAIDSVLVEQPEEENAPFGDGTVAALRYMLDLGEKMGFKTHNFENVVGWIEYGEGLDVIGVLCHLDVVPTGEGWTTPPFEANVRDGKIYGRGTQDDKGPAMAALYAMKSLKDNGVMGSKRIRLILGTDEETGSRGLIRYIKEFGMPTASFSPDADFPVIYGEKGICSIDIVSNTPIEDVELHSGDRYNVVPEEATCKCSLDLDHAFDKYLKSNKLKGEMGDNTYTVYGKRAHAMEPLNGVNALVKLCNFLSDKVDVPLIEFISKYLNSSRLVDLGLNFKNKEMGDLVMNVAVCDIDNEGSRVGLNLRYPEGWNINEFVIKLQNITEPFGLYVKIVSDSKPLFVPKDSPLVKTLYDSYVKYSHDLESKPITIGGGTYARHLKNAVAFGCLFPGKECTDHNVDEYATVKDLLLSEAIYADAMEKLSK